MDEVRALIPGLKNPVTLWRGRKAMIWHFDRDCPKRRFARRLMYRDTELLQVPALPTCRHCRETAPLDLRARLCGAQVAASAMQLAVVAPDALLGLATRVRDEVKGVRERLTDHESQLAQLRTAAATALDKLDKLDEIDATGDNGDDDVVIDPDAIVAARAQLSCDVELIDSVERAVEVVRATADALEGEVDASKDLRRSAVARRCAARVHVAGCPIEAAFVARTDENTVRSLRTLWATTIETTDADTAAVAVDHVIDQVLAEGPTRLSQLVEVPCCDNDQTPLDALVTAWGSAVRSTSAALAAEWARRFEEADPDSEETVVVLASSTLRVFGATVEEIRTACPAVPAGDACPEHWATMRVRPAMAAFLLAHPKTSDLVAVIPEMVASNPEVLRSVLTATAALARDSDESLGACVLAAVTVTT